MKKDRKKKENVEDKALEKVNTKEKFSKRFINTIKKKWLISGTNTILLIAILIATFVLINIGVSKLDLTPIDCTTSKAFTLTDESKDRVKGIDKEVNIFLVGYGEDNTVYDLVKQYGKANSKINIEKKDLTTDMDFANKYGISSEQVAIVVESGEVSKILLDSDLYSYDENYSVVDLTEEKVTSTILNVTSGDIPNVYFLEGYTSINFTNGLSYLKQYLDDEVLKYSSLNILNTGNVPDDCDTLVVINPEKDFDELTSNSIIDYINRGGNIIWLGGVYAGEVDLTNVNKVLAEYGVDPFEAGFVYETNAANTVLDYAICFKPEVQDTEITSKVYNGLGSIFLRANKININEEKLEELKVEETKLIISSNTTFFSTDMSGKTSTSTDERGGFTLGDQLVKTITEEEGNEVVSKLIIYGNEYFVSDFAISEYVNPMIYIYNNKDLFLNSVAYLNDRDEDLTIRKDYSESVTSFTPTDQEKTVIMTIIFAVPLLIIIAGIVVKIVRKRRK